MNKEIIRILVAEDEPKYIWAIKTNLEARGYFARILKTAPEK